MKADAPQLIDLFGDPRQLRAWWLEHLSRAVDGQLRSTAFLHGLWYTLTTLATLQSLRSSGAGLLSTWARQAPIPVGGDGQASTTSTRAAG